MKKKVILITFLFILFCNDILFAQTDSSKIEFDFSLRERFESWSGMNAANYGDNSPDAIGSLHDNNLFQRVITGITYKPIKSLIFEFHMQDSRAFEWSLRNSSYPDLFKIGKTGTEYPFYIMNPNEAFFEIHDASIEYQNVLENTLSLQNQ